MINVTQNVRVTSPLKLYLFIIFHLQFTNEIRYGKGFLFFSLSFFLLCIY